MFIMMGVQFVSMSVFGKNYLVGTISHIYHNKSRDFSVQLENGNKILIKAQYLH